DRSIAYPAHTRSPSQFLRLYRELRALEADTLVYMMGGRGLARIHRDLAFFRLCGFKSIVGAPRSRDDDRGPVDDDGCDEPEAERLARVLSPLGPVQLDSPEEWSLRLGPDEHRRAAEVLQPLAGAPFIAVNMGGKAAAKDWGEANWAKL